jgi:ribosomal protein S12 methylthiotransferase accessory factor YcaO
VDLNRIILDLKAERDRLAAAIECLEQLVAGRARKRGRPPKWLSERGEGTQPSNADAPKNDSERPPAGLRSGSDP